MKPAVHAHASKCTLSPSSCATLCETPTKGELVIYVVSDIHGRYDKWQELLHTIKPTWADTIYVLGDTIDRGPEGLKTLLEMADMPNVIHLLGNHESMLMSVLPMLLAYLTDEVVSDLDQSSNAIAMLANYMANGGETTADELSRLDAIERKKIRVYILSMGAFEEIEVRDKTYLLVHAGLDNFAPEKPLEEYDLHDFLWVRHDVRKRYYPDKTVVFGHTPTRKIRQKYGIGVGAGTGDMCVNSQTDLGIRMGTKSSISIHAADNDASENSIIVAPGMIAIDCGCGHGGPLGCLCLDTMERVYV